MGESMEPKDRKVLRDLAKRVADIADDPVMSARRSMWVEHNSLRSTYPMMLVFPEDGWQELIPEESLRCSGADARDTELSLRRRIYAFEHFQDDTVIEKEWPVHQHIRNTGWGMEPRRVPSTEARGAWRFDPVIKSPSDLKKLRPPAIGLDAGSTRKAFAATQELLGDILEVRLTGVRQISYHLMNIYTRLRGLEEAMIDMYDEPRMLHDAMAFLAEGHRGVLDQYVKLNVLSFNNDGTYHGSGGNGYTDELPRRDAVPVQVRPCDMWASAEAQEMAQVGPEQHEEFVLAYEGPLLEPFGLTGYGCCEDLTRKLDYVVKIPNMRRISISPWSDVDVCAERLKGRFIFSWKPNPAHLVGKFDPEAVREYVRHTVEAALANGCVLEVILKDTHTCENHTERFDEWTRIAREVIEETVGPSPAVS
jgi:hypothetical protein